MSDLSFKSHTNCEDLLFVANITVSVFLEGIKLIASSSSKSAYSMKKLIRTH